MKRLRQKAYHWLRRSESFFKTDMVYLAKGGFWLNSSQLASLAVSFLLSIAFANILTQNQYGTYKYVIAAGSILASLSLSGLPTALMRAVARGYEGSLLRSFWINIRWSMIIVAASATASFYYYIQGNTILAVGLLVAGTLGSIIDSAELYNSFLYGKKDFRLASILRFIRTLLASFGLFLTILFTQNPLYIVLSYFFLHCMLALSLFIYVIKRNRPNKSLDPELPHLAKHASLINNFASFTDSIDNLLVFHYFGAAQLAVYNFAQAMPEQLSGLLKNINVLATPKFAQRDKEDIRNSLHSKSIRVFLVGFFGMVAYIIAAPFIFHFVFPQYISSVAYSQVYSLILLFSAALPVAFLDSQMAIRAKYKLAAVTGVFKLASIIFGVVYFGIWGLIFARILSKIVGLLYSFVLIRKI